MAESINLVIAVFQPDDMIM